MFIFWPHHFALRGGCIGDPELELVNYILLLVATAMVEANFPLEPVSELLSH